MIRRQKSSSFCCWMRLWLLDSRSLMKASVRPKSSSFGSFTFSWISFAPLTISPVLRAIGASYSFLVVIFLYNIFWSYATKPGSFLTFTASHLSVTSRSITYIAGRAVSLSKKLNDVLFSFFVTFASILTKSVFSKIGISMELLPSYRNWHWRMTSDLSSLRIFCPNLSRSVILISTCLLLYSVLFACVS